MWNKTPEAKMQLKENKLIKNSKHIETLSAQLQPETLNDENRTVDCVWFSGVDVPRMNYFTGETYTLRFDPNGVDLSVLNAGAPVLDDHDAFSGTSGQKGVVEKAWIDDGNYKATLRFSKRPEVAGLWQDIQDKIVTKFSMGTEILSKKDVSEKESTQRTFLATKWRPYEISVTSIPADFNTTTLSNEVTEDSNINNFETEEGAANEILAHQELEEKMPETTYTSAETNVVNLDAERTKGRNDAIEILNRCNAAKLSTEFASKLITENKSVEDATKEIFAELAKKDSVTETRSQVTVTRDQGDTRREQMTAALLHRVDSGKFKIENDNEYHHMSMLRMAEECLSATGQRVKGLAPSEVARLALHTTSDFPNILAAGANKSLLAAYQYANPSYKQWAKAATVPDFKTVSRNRIGEFPVLEQVAEGGTIHSGTMGENKESYSIATYAKIFGISRQSIVNDDLGVFSSFAGPIGTQVAILENKTVYSVLTSTSTMSDGVALFHSTHANLAGSGTAISVTSLDVGSAAMMIQKGIDGVSPLNITPRFLIVPVAKRVLALQYTNVPNIVYTKGSDFNPFAGTLEVVADANLDGSSTTAWFLAADPVWSAVEYATLEGNSGPVVSQRVGFEVDGVEIKAVHDFGAKAIEYRALYKNPGA